MGAKIKKEEEIKVENDEIIVLEDNDIEDEKLLEADVDSFNISTSSSNSFIRFNSVIDCSGVTLVIGCGVVARTHL